MDITYRALMTPQQAWAKANRQWGRELNIAHVTYMVTADPEHATFWRSVLELYEVKHHVPHHQAEATRRVAY